MVRTSEQHLVRNVTPTSQALRRLGKILHDAPAYAVASTPGLRRVTQAVLVAGEPVKPLVELLTEFSSRDRVNGQAKSGSPSGSRLHTVLKIGSKRSQSASLLSS